MREKDPIDRIEWRDAATLNANDYNPNVVHKPELRLLEFSIVKVGWFQPVLIADDGTIIDGFHRAMLAKDSKALRDKYGGKVPCVVLPLSRVDAMFTTIRVNRAKGTHVALRMSKIVHELIDVHGVDPKQIQQEIGATREEVELLRQDGVFTAKDIKNYKYSQAWYPKRAEKTDAVDPSST
jgi:ParB-like chromosome segregation protein Spo0J